MGLANQEPHADLGCSLRVPCIRMSSHVYVPVLLLLFRFKCGTDSKRRAHVRILRLLRIMVPLRVSISGKQIFHLIVHLTVDKSSMSV